MRRGRTRHVIVAVLAMTLLALAPAAPAGAIHDVDPRTKNLHPMGHIEEPASLLNPDQGSWLGFNIRDISAPGNPKHVSSTVCEGNQGDVIVWDTILVRSWNSPAALGAMCDGVAVPAGFEGLHIFDISDLEDPALVGSVDLSTGAILGRCGSHTATGVPDAANNRLLVYNSGSGCDGIDIVEVPLGNPAGATYLRTEVVGRACHDTAVILGDAMLAACAGGDGYAMWTLTGSGTLENPDLLYERAIDGVGIGHAASFTWDGEVFAFGHEPGGGVQANCQASNLDSDKSAFFFDALTGEQLGTWVLPRDQSATENCTIHNFNVVPLRSGRDVMVVGNYQAGTWVVDFTDPENPQTLAWSDPPPAPVPPPPFDFLGLDIVGAWSSYWYNNFIYETNIGEGLNVFRFSGKETAGALQLDHLNPQTQEFTL